MRWLFAAVAFAVAGGAGCGLSPVTPTEAEGEPRLVLGYNIAPTVANGVVYYSCFYFVSVPSYGRAVRVDWVDCTVRGPDGTVYGTARQSGFDVPPGDSRFSPQSGAYIISDRDLTRPFGTTVHIVASVTPLGGGASRLLEGTDTLGGGR